ncbi:MAG TPA: DNA cytosine methyltransferase [Candidatus Limnocylindria bacterium]|nr:DNA cytosine methyltransferase [Candidatus Limnocylindria bacterium]
MEALTLEGDSAARHARSGCERLVARPLVVDLFAGMGGLSLGFRQVGFEVHGYDAERHAVASYAANVGPARLMNLRDELPDEVPAILVGGPPCRPWSPINLQRRRTSHSDYDLVDRFRQSVIAMHPCAFVLENVPFLKNDAQYRALIESLAVQYVLTEDIYSYAEWGAATRRRRLFAIGIEKGHTDGTSSVVDGISRRRRNPQSVAEAIRGLSLDRADPHFDHDWPQFRTIEKYAHKYATGKYGWYRLDEGVPAPSFGNVMKTYTLRRGSGGIPDRAVSPREAIAILGFPSSYRFPAAVPRTAKYRMAADAVSPVFGEVVAEVLAEELGWSRGGPHA